MSRLSFIAGMTPARLPQRRRRRAARARGAVVLELSISLLLFMTLTMGLLDLGVGVFRFHVISQGARYVARRAMVHGSMASALGTWGPSTVNATLSTTGVAPIDGADGVLPMIVGCDPATTNLQIEWPEGNEFGDRVRVTMTTTYQPLLLFIFTGATEKNIDSCLHSPYRPLIAPGETSR